MNHAGEVASAVDGRPRHVPLSRRVLKVSRLQELLHYLAGSASRVMGNQQAGPSPPPRQDRRASLPNIKSFHWSIGPQVTDVRDDPPEFLIKLAKVITSKFRGEVGGDICACVCARLYIPLSCASNELACGATRKDTTHPNTLWPFHGQKHKTLVKVFQVTHEFHITLTSNHLFLSSMCSGNIA